MAHSLAAGDWNGDGYDDVLAGSLHTNEDPGKVWLFLGNPTSTAESPALVITDVAATPNHAPVVAFIGDVNDDGGEDFAIGAHGWTDHHIGVLTGRVYIFLSDPTLVTPATLSTVDADIVLEAPSGVHLNGGALAHFGFSVAAAGDVNDDGFEDLLIGAPGPVAIVGPTDPELQGEAYLYHGTDPTSWVPGAEFVLAHTFYGGGSEHVLDRFGWSVAGVGDVDGNGFDDVVVTGTWAATLNAALFSYRDIGFAHLYLGPSFAAPVEIAPPASDDAWLFGHRVVGGEDLTGDGRADILIGAPYYSVAGNSQGAVYAYSISTQGLVVEAFEEHQPVTLDPGAPAPFIDDLTRFGWSIDVVGQYDQGGGAFNPTEFVVGAWFAPNEADVSVCPLQPQGGRQSGRTLVLSVETGLGGLITVQCLYRGEQGEEGGRMRLGTSVAAGDFNGDGEPDIATGGSGFSETTQADEVGRLYFFINPQGGP